MFTDGGTSGVQAGVYKVYTTQDMFSAWRIPKGAGVATYRQLTRLVSFVICLISAITQHDRRLVIHEWYL